MKVHQIIEDKTIKSFFLNPVKQVISRFKAWFVLLIFNCDKCHWLSLPTTVEKSNQKKSARHYCKKNMLHCAIYMEELVSMFIERKHSRLITVNVLLFYDYINIKICYSTLLHFFLHSLYALFLGLWFFVASSLNLSRSSSIILFPRHSKVNFIEFYTTN